MKKGLLSILAASLLVVGCQDYDDQFSSLESQISALATTVAGLSQVQSDLASLAGTVGSLATTVNGLGDQIDTAVSSGLADIQADIDAIETAVADVASSEEVSTLSDAVSDAQDDLTDLLAASSVFTGDVVVNSVNTLDAYLAMGAALNIVNGNVNITVTTAMDQTKVQTLVDNILTIVQDLTYESKASSIAETTFDNLTGVQSLTITQGGGMRFPNLISATNVYLKDDFESSVAVIHFGSLTSVSGIDTDAETNTIRFTKATELHLTALEYYPGATLTIETDEGAAMPFALDDIDADGDTLEDGLTLDITGPASFAPTKIADGSITLTDVKTVNLTDFKGAVSINGDVESFTSNSLVSLTVATTAKLETVDVTGVADPDATTAAPSYGPAVSLDTLGDLETVTIAGLATSVNIGTNANLKTLTISADVAGSITVDNNGDLETATFTGAKATALDFDTNGEIATLTVDLAWRAGTAATAVLDGDLDVTDNASLETLTVSSDGIENLTVTGNDELTKVDFTGVDSIGATGTADVDIYDNDLTATKLTDSDDGTTDVADGKTGDLGSITTTSGMDTLKEYLTAVAADADSAANVYFDTVESFTNESDTESTDILYSSSTAQNAGTVLLLVAKVVGTASADGVKHKVAYGIKTAGLGGKFGIFADDATNRDKTHALFLDSSGDPTTSITLNALEGLAISEITSAANLTRATAYDYTLNAYTGYNPSGKITILAAADSSTADYSVNGLNAWYGNANKATASSADVLKLTINGQSVTTTVGATNWLGTGATVFNSTANSANDFAKIVANRLATAWDDAYGTGGTSATESLFDVTTTTDGEIGIVVKDAGSGRRGFDKSYSVSLIRKETNTATPIFGAYYGATTDSSDNNTITGGIVVTLESNKPGTILDVVKGASYTSSMGTNFAKLTSTLQVNADPQVATSTSLDIFENEARGDLALGAGGDAVLPEGDVDEVATAAVDFSRVAWLD